MKRPANSCLSSFGTTIFATMSAMAGEYDSLNLGQGAPDEDGPLELREIAARALIDGPNQYPSMWGVPALLDAVSQHEKRFYDLDLSPQGEILITSGATQGLCSTLMGLLNPGDEVVLLEPMYDSYLPIIEYAGATARPVRLQPPNWELSFEEIEKAFNDKTRLLVLNTPMNPTGKVFNATELDRLADILIRHDAFCLCDEVYEHLVFDGLEHIPLMTRPKMKERCIRVGSAGKTFSMTGWKIGYVMAHHALMKPIAKAHQFTTFTIPPHLQKAVAAGLMFDDGFFQNFIRDMQSKRDLLVAGLQQTGFDVLPSHGSYFVNVDIRSVGFQGTDLEFCEEITKKAGVSAIPVSAFYRKDGPAHLVRFCFCKKPEILSASVARLSSYFNK